MKSARWSCQIFMKFEFSQQMFEQSSDMKFHENGSAGSYIFLAEEADIHGEANICFQKYD